MPWRLAGVQIELVGCALDIAIVEAIDRVEPKGSEESVIIQLDVSNILRWLGAVTGEQLLEFAVPTEPHRSASECRHGAAVRPPLTFFEGERDAATSHSHHRCPRMIEWIVSANSAPIPKLSAAAAESIEPDQPDRHFAARRVSPHRPARAAASIGGVSRGIRAAPASTQRSCHAWNIRTPQSR